MTGEKIIVPNQDDVSNKIRLVRKYVGQGGTPPPVIVNQGIKCTYGKEEAALASTNYFGTTVELDGTFSIDGAGAQKRIVLSVETPMDPFDDSEIFMMKLTLRYSSDVILAGGVTEKEAFIEYIDAEDFTENKACWHYPNEDDTYWKRRINQQDLSSPDEPKPTTAWDGTMGLGVDGTAPYMVILEQILPKGWEGLQRRVRFMISDSAVAGQEVEIDILPELIGLDKFEFDSKYTFVIWVESHIGLGNDTIRFYNPSTNSFLGEPSGLWSRIDLFWKKEFDHRLSDEYELVSNAKDYREEIGNSGWTGADPSYRLAALSKNMFGLRWKRDTNNYWSDEDTEFFGAVEPTSLFRKEGRFSGLIEYEFFAYDDAPPANTRMMIDPTDPKWKGLYTNIDKSGFGIRNRLDDDDELEVFFYWMDSPSLLDERIWNFNWMYWIMVRQKYRDNYGQEHFGYDFLFDKAYSFPSYAVSPIMLPGVSFIALNPPWDAGDNRFEGVVFGDANERSIDLIAWAYTTNVDLEFLREKDKRVAGYRVILYRNPILGTAFFETFDVMLDKKTLITDDPDNYIINGYSQATVINVPIPYKDVFSIGVAVIMENGLVTGFQTREHDHPPTDPNHPSSFLFTEQNPIADFIWSPLGPIFENDTPIILNGEMSRALAMNSYIAKYNWFLDGNPIFPIDLPTPINDLTLYTVDDFLLKLEVTTNDLSSIDAALGPKTSFIEKTISSIDNTPLDIRTELSKLANFSMTSFTIMESQDARQDKYASSDSWETLMGGEKPPQISFKIEAEGHDAQLVVNQLRTWRKDHVYVQVRKRVTNTELGGPYGEYYYEVYKGFLKSSRITYPSRRKIEINCPMLVLSSEVEFEDFPVPPPYKIEFDWGGDSYSLGILEQTPMERFPTTTWPLPDWEDRTIGNADVTGAESHSAPNSLHIHNGAVDWLQKASTWCVEFWAKAIKGGSSYWKTQLRWDNTSGPSTIESNPISTWTQYRIIAFQRYYSGSGNYLLVNILQKKVGGTWTDVDVGTLWNTVTWWENPLWMTLGSIFSGGGYCDLYLDDFVFYRIEDVDVLPPLQLDEQFNDLDSWTVMNGSPYVSGGILYLPYGISDYGSVRSIRQDFHLAKVRASIDGDFINNSGQHSIYLLANPSSYSGMAFYKEATGNLVHLYTYRDGLLEDTVIGALPAGYRTIELVPDSNVAPTKIELWVDSVLKATHTIRVPDPALSYWIDCIGPKWGVGGDPPTKIDWIEVL